MRNPTAELGEYPTLLWASWGVFGENPPIEILAKIREELHPHKMHIEQSYQLHSDAYYYWIAKLAGRHYYTGHTFIDTCRRIVDEITHMGKEVT